MAVDEGIIQNFENQIKVLQQLKDRINDSIETANRQLERLKNGEPLEKIFGIRTKQSQPAQGGDAKDYQQQRN